MCVSQWSVVTWFAEHIVQVNHWLLMESQLIAATPDQVTPTIQTTSKPLHFEMNWNSYIYLESLLLKIHRNARQYRCMIWVWTHPQRLCYEINSNLYIWYLYFIFKRNYGDQRWKTTMGMRQFWWTDESFWVWVLITAQCNAKNTNICLYFELPWYI